MIATIVAAMTARFRTIEAEKNKSKNKNKVKLIGKSRNRPSNTSRGVGRYMGTNSKLDVLKLDE